MLEKQDALSQLFSLEPRWIKSVDKLMTDLAVIAKLGWDQGGREIDSRTPFNLGNPFVQQQLLRTRNLLVRISDEVYKEIVAALSKAVAQGLDIRGQAEAVRNVLDVTGSENWPARAKAVAVTEVNRAWNFGVIAHGLTVQQREGVLVLKRWDSRDDARVRLAHEDADGQIRPISQPFIVGGEALMAPLDPSGAPSNVINCRCKARLRRVS